VCECFVLMCVCVCDVFMNAFVIFEAKHSCLFYRKSSNNYNIYLVVVSADVMPTNCQ